MYFPPIVVTLSNLVIIYNYALKILFFKLQILELQKRFEAARAQIRLLPGIDYNKEEQLQKLELLKNQLRLKQQLIRKYKDKEFKLSYTE